MGDDKCTVGKVIGTMIEGQCLTRFFGQPNERQKAEALADHCNQTNGDGYYVESRRDSLGGVSRSWMTTYILRRRLNDKESRELAERLSLEISELMSQLWHNILTGLGIFIGTTRHR